MEVLELDPETSKPSEVMARAIELPVGLGVQMKFDTMRELHSYRVRLYNTRKYVQRRRDGVSGWERLSIKIDNRKPPTLWVGVLTPKVLGIKEIVVGVPPKAA